MNSVASDAALSRQGLAWLSLICVAALIVRVATGLLLPNIIHQDETFQYLEQGHRLVFGTGLVPWEYIVGTRSWLFPGLIAGVIELSRPFGHAPETAQAAIIIFMAMLSLAPVVCGFLWGWRQGGLAAAVAAGSLNAAWFELVYFSTHTLSETMAANALVVGLFLAYPGLATPTSRRLMLGGLFFGLALVFRVQLGPAIALGIIAICGTSIRARYLPLLLGAALPILLSGLLDAMTWDWPFQSMALNLWVNVKEGVAAQFSKSPPYQYLSLQVTYWTGAFVLVAALALWGGRRLPVLLIVAATIVVTHSLLSHKEYRFIYPALPLIMTLAGIASAEVARRLAGNASGPWTQAALLLGVPLFWIGTSLILARSREFYPLWYRDRGSIEAAHIINRDSAACGVGIYPADLWDRGFGYARLKPELSIYAYGEGDSDATLRAFNYLVGYKPADFSARGYMLDRCWSEPPGRTIAVDPICLWKRPGTCEAGAAALLTATPPVFLLRDHPGWFSKRGG